MRTCFSIYSCTVSSFCSYKVVELINEHFNKYLIENKLTKSIGVVAFGEKQRDYIYDLVNKDEELMHKIETALKNKDSEFSDEKVIFFKTIEEVQGQETDHLILSLTYGVDKNGEFNSRFGEMNRDKLGQCIFNVAVTRSKYCVSLVHSIRFNNIDYKNNRIDYIREYLKLVEDFSNIGKCQFIEEPPSTNLLKEIKNLLVERGIGSDRIITNYGVTKGSVKIPIVILDELKQNALFGIFVESPFNKQYHYLDYNINYYNILINLNKWRLLRINIYDWYINKQKCINDIINFINIEREEKNNGKN